MQKELTENEKEFIGSLSALLVRHKADLFGIPLLSGLHGSREDPDNYTLYIRGDGFCIALNDVIKEIGFEQEIL